MNPFRYGQIVSKRDFCSRPELVQQLMGFAESGQNVFLQGERRTGKTSLIHEAVRKLSGFRLLYIDLLEIKTLDDLCRRIITAIVRLENKISFQSKVLKYLSHLRPSLSLDPVTGFPSVSFDFRMGMKPDTLDGILDLIEELGKKKKLVVAIDEFQDVLNLKDSSSVLAQLRSRIQFHTEITYFFAGSVRNSMNEIFTSPSSPFFKSAASLEVGKIAEKRFIPFLKRRFASGKRKVSKAMITRIMGMAGGIPGDVQELCACVWECTSQGDSISEDHLHSGLSMIFSREKKAYEAILVNISGQQLRCLVALAEDNSVKMLSSDFLRRTGIGTASSVQTAIRRLIKLKIIYRHKDHYRLANPFFGSWLLRRGF